jgi:lipid-binding SYLF domain-containing protein
MNTRKISALSVMVVSFFLLTGFFGNDTTPEQQRIELKKMQGETLNKLYKLAPQAKQEIQNAAGYAVFSNTGINLLLLSTANGTGVAHNNHSGKDIFINMLSGGVGIGLGVKDFRGVFVFASQDVFNQFVNEGWQAGAQADVAAKSGDKGDALTMAIDVAPGIKMYQITENGLALQATIQGTKYWKDDDLNK